MTSLTSHWKACQDSNLQHKQTKRLHGEKKLPKDHYYGSQASKDRRYFFTQGHKHFFWEICCQKAFEKFENNNEIKVCLMRWRTRGRLGGKKTESDFSCRVLFCPGKWDVFLPYVHLPQLTAHIRKGLLKRGNNEKEREMESCAVCFSSLHLAGTSSQQALRDLLFLQWFHQD